MRLGGKGLNKGVFQWMLQKYVGIGDKVTGFCEYSNESSGAIEGVEFPKFGGRSVRMFRAVNMNNSVFWVLTLCSLETPRRFAVPYRLHLQGRRVGHARNQ
jgi:hypothetical protein